MRFSKLGVFFALSALLVLSLGSCRHDKRYADYLEDERAAIRSYIKNNSIQVVDEKPASAEEWLDEDGNPVYYHFSDGLYFHLIEKGDTTTLAPNVGNTAFIRYVGTNMAGTVVYDCSSKLAANPQNFRILSSPSSDNTFGQGFQKAVRNLYSGGHCKIIIPFKIGNGYNNTVHGTTITDAGMYQPMIYEIWLCRVE
ncbi:MAG: DUF4827 family protein [Bacteroidales bacterium]|nr:DUF4827 family protein [Candidatus Physcocola equi]